jgi:hypothetical protein
VIQALIFGFQVLMESRQASVRSTGEIFFDRIPAAACLQRERAQIRRGVGDANRVAATAPAPAARKPRRDGFCMHCFTALKLRIAFRYFPLDPGQLASLPDRSDKRRAVKHRASIGRAAALKRLRNTDELSLEIGTRRVHNGITVTPCPCGHPFRTNSGIPTGWSALISRARYKTSVS